MVVRLYGQCSGCGLRLDGRDSEGHHIPRFKAQTQVSNIHRSRPTYLVLPGISKILSDMILDLQNNRERLANFNISSSGGK